MKQLSEKSEKQFIFDGDIYQRSEEITHSFETINFIDWSIKNKTTGRWNILSKAVQAELESMFQQTQKSDVETSILLTEFVYKCCEKGIAISDCKKEVRKLLTESNYISEILKNGDSQNE